MPPADLGPKHFHVHARWRRFDPGSRYGGRGGATLVKAKPRSWIGNDGFADIVLKAARPTDGEGNVLVSRLDEELPELLGCQPASAASGGRLFRLPELLEAECTAKSTRRDRQLHDIVVATYTLDAVGASRTTPNEHEHRRLERQREAFLSLAYRAAPAMRVGVHGELPAGASEGQVLYTICRMKEGTNRCRAPASRAGWRCGCNKCGRCRGCKAWRSRPRAARQLLRRRLLEEAGEDPRSAAGCAEPPAPAEASRRALIEALGALLPEEAEDSAAAPGSRCSDLPGLALTRSSSDSEVVRVDALDAVSASDEEEWLVVLE